MIRTITVFACASCLGACAVMDMPDPGQNREADWMEDRLNQANAERAAPQSVPDHDIPAGTREGMAEQAEIALQQRDALAAERLQAEDSHPGDTEEFSRSGQDRTTPPE